MGGVGDTQRKKIFVNHDFLIISFSLKFRCHDVDIYSLTHSIEIFNSKSNYPID